MNVLISGITSFIGSRTAKILLDEGKEVFGIVRPGSKNLKNIPGRTRIIELDFNECEKLKEMKLPEFYAAMSFAWDGAGAGERNNEKLQKQNADNTFKFMDAAAALGCRRFIFSGSQAEYGVTLEKAERGEISEDPVGEEYNPEPVSAYGREKLRVLTEGSLLCRENKMTYIHLRFYSVFGPGDHKNSLVSKCCAAFKNPGEVMKLGSCRQKWNFLYIDDAAKAAADMIDTVFTTEEDEISSEHVVNIASENTAKLRKFVESIREVCGSGEFEFDVLPPREEGTYYLDPDITRLKNLTGFRETKSFGDGIREILKVQK